MPALSTTPSKSAHRLRDALRSADLMHHAIEVRGVDDRRAWLAQLCAGRSVLHVGCCDVPIFDPNNNLHIFLSQQARRLDGLDISEDGIALLRRHVDGDYFTDPAEVTRSYDVVLVPEVLEHTFNPGEFLSGIFSVQAKRYLVTAPNIEWYARTKREGTTWNELVHGDHKAWYSPYTLLNTLRPFMDEARDEVEVFLLEKTGSVGVMVTKPTVVVAEDHGREEPACGTVQALELAARHAARREEARALSILVSARAAHEDERLVHAELTLLLGLERTMDALRRGVSWLGAHPADDTCRGLCADAMEKLGDHDRARKLRRTPRR